LESSSYLARLYANRFKPDERVAKERLWKVLIEAFLQRRVPPDAVIVDVGGGYGEFATHVSARRRILVDLNPDAADAAAAGVEVLRADVTQLDRLTELAGTVDVVFISNLLEHLASTEAVFQTLDGCAKLLRRGGTLMIIQPNFRFAFREYYDFIDHRIPLTDRSLREIVELAGFRIDELIARFLPYSTKGRPSSPALLRLYLALPLLWRVFGAQTFVRATRR
jgi:2-polyprenyl-3-methyl-5-hydroxy-6-metoxy-1,4-benzoquinol methylase